MTATTEPTLEPDLPIIDPHHHLWSVPAFGDGGPYLLPQFMADISTGHNIRGTVYIEAHAHYRCDGPEALRPVGETEAANAMADENARSPERERRICAAIIGHANLLLGDAVDEVLDAHQLAAPRRFRGIRHILCPDSRIDRFEDRERLLANPVFRGGLRRLGERGLLFEVMAWHYQLPDLIDAVRAVPEVHFILNHVGSPMGIGPYAGRRSEVLQDWGRDIATLARETNISVKLGGLGMPTMGFDWFATGERPSSDVLAKAFAPYFDHAIQSFGPHRAMFESNVPPDLASADYPTLWNAFKRFSATYTAEERALMFHDNAARLYRL